MGLVARVYGYVHGSMGSCLWAHVYGFIYSCLWIRQWVYWLVSMGLSMGLLARVYEFIPVVD